MSQLFISTPNKPPKLAKELAKNTEKPADFDKQNIQILRNYRSKLYKPHILLAKRIKGNHYNLTNPTFFPYNYSIIKKQRQG